MFGLGKKKVTLGAVFAGQAVTLDKVPDPVFSQGMLGEGIAIVPPEAVDTLDVCSPVAGTVTKLFKTGHAFVAHSAEGLDVLVHIGLETVGLKGEGFTILAKQGDTVEVGTPLVRIDLAKIREAGLNPITPIVLTAKEQVAKVEPQPGDVETGSPVAVVTLA